PVMDDIFRIKFCPLEPIYVINYVQLPTSDTLQNEITFFSKVIRFYILMKNSNERKLFDSCLDENNEDYKKRITTELLDKSSTIYPTKLTKPNFIVDLMDTPGDFIPIGSPCSKLYISYY
ncbi:hypothetical protein ALC57_02929, partial [Trachymyrmex cornetzi]